MNDIDKMARLKSKFFVSFLIHSQGLVEGLINFHINLEVDLTSFFDKIRSEYFNLVFVSSEIPSIFVTTRLKGFSP